VQAAAGGKMPLGDMAVDDSGRVAFLKHDRLLAVTILHCGENDRHRRLKRREYPQYFVKTI
jgi:hypothetical protein